MSGDVKVSIVDKISIDGVDMLLRNDLVGQQVEICPVLCEKPAVADETYVICQVMHQICTQNVL